MLALLLAFAGWGSYMIRSRRSVHRRHGPDSIEPTVNAEKQERPGWLDMHLAYEETSAKEALVGYLRPRHVALIVADIRKQASFCYHLG